MKPKRKTPLMDKLGGTHKAATAVWFDRNTIWAPESVSTDVLRRRIALDQRQYWHGRYVERTTSTYIQNALGEWVFAPDSLATQRPAYWDSIPLASTQEASCAIACPNAGAIFDWQPDSYSMLP